MPGLVKSTATCCYTQTGFNSSSLHMYCIYWNVKEVLSLNLVFKYEIVLNSSMKCRTRPCGAKPRPAITKSSCVDKRQNTAWLKLTDTIYFFGLRPSSNFFKISMTSRHLTWWTPQIKLISVTGHHRNRKLVKICVREQIESKGSNRKMATEQLKINYKTQLKSGQMHKLKTIKSHECRLIRTHVFEIINITNTVCAENSQSFSWVQVSLQTKEYDFMLEFPCIISQCI
jgi:hypothetical protein